MGFSKGTGDNTEKKFNNQWIMLNDGMHEDCVSEEHEGEQNGVVKS